MINVVSIAGQYMNEMHEEFHYYATWEPGTPLSIGDVGVLNHNEFNREANLDDLNIKYQVLRDPSSNPLRYVSKGNTSIMTKIAGEANIPGVKGLKVADAGVVINFKKEKGVAFEALGVTHQTIKNIIALKQDIINAYKEKKWQKEWVVITDLISAKSATVLISKAADASVELHAKADVPDLSIANVDAKT